MNMEMSGHETPVSLDKIIELALMNNDEGWQEIDALLPTVCNDPVFIAWAKKNTAHQESALRDLAATILGATTERLSDEDVDRLLSLMREQDPDNPYPRFRAAAALVQKGAAGQPPVRDEVAAVLREYLDDAGVADLARQHLESL